MKKVDPATHDALGLEQPASPTKLRSDLHIPDRRKGSRRDEDTLTGDLREANALLVSVTIRAQELAEEANATKLRAETTARELRALSDRLTESEERQRRMIEASGAGLWDLEAATGQLATDARVLELMALPPHTALTLDSALACILHEDRQRVSLAVSNALAAVNEGRFLVEFRTHGLGDAPERWVESRAHALFDADGRGLRLAGVLLDITARKQADAAREAVLEALFVHPGLTVCLLEGPNFVLKMVNSMYRAQIAGGRDVVGMPLLEALPELEGQGFEKLLDEVIRTREPFIGQELSAQLRSGPGGAMEERSFKAVFQKLNATVGTPDTVLIISQEVTELVRARQAAEALLEKERERADFEQQLIGIVSHDLRNPINAIMLSASMLERREDLAERQRRGISRILLSAHRAGRMIADLLDFTKARLDGGFPVKLQPLDFHDVAREAVGEIQVSNPERVIGIRQEGNGQGSWDGDRMTQVLGNLLTNAFNYSPPDSVVEVVTRGQGDDVVLEVHNWGVPIPAELLPQLFKPFRRGQGSNVNASRSVGLGLFIVKHIVDAHRGTVDVTSTEKTGTTFTVKLPR